MDIKEFSDQFDILVNSYAIEYPIGKQDLISFDEYEKSLFLSNSQEDFVISCYNGKNAEGCLFEHTEDDRRILDALIKTVCPEEDNDSRHIPLSSNSKFYTLPKDLLRITYESCDFSSDDKCLDGRNAIVVPTTQDEFYRTNQNPFRQANDHRVLRLDYNDNTVELVSKNNISKYIVRYLAKPTPIVLVDLPEGLSIDGVNTRSECVLDESTHRRILERAVRMALQSKSIGFNK